MIDVTALEMLAPCDTVLITQPENDALGKPQQTADHWATARQSAIETFINKHTTVSGV